MNFNEYTSCLKCDSKQNMREFVPSFSCRQNYDEPQKLASQPGQKPNMEAGKFKTKLCHHFMTTGTCYYGTKCHFAHGKHELRRTEDAGPLIHPRHKTTLCQNELRHGVCKFGKGCMFIHKEDPEYTTLQQQMLNRHSFLPSSHESKTGSEPVKPTINEYARPMSILSGLFLPINKVYQEIKEPTAFTPGTPLIKRSHEDRRAAAASVWGALSPRVAVWEQHLCGAMRN